MRNDEYKPAQRLSAWIIAISLSFACLLLITSLMAQLIAPETISTNIQKLVAIDFINTSKPEPNPPRNNKPAKPAETAELPQPAILPESEIQLSQSLPVTETLTTLALVLPTLNIEINNLLPDMPSLSSPATNASPAFDEELYPLFKADPVYPRRAKRSNTQGWVNIAFTINVQGRVEDIEILAAEPEGLFDTSSINAVKKWQFKPQLLAGKATARRVVQTIKFELNK